MPASISRRCRARSLAFRPQPRIPASRAPSGCRPSARRCRRWRERRTTAPPRTSACARSTFRASAGRRCTAPGSFTPSTSTLAAVGAGQEIFDFGRIAAQAAVADVALRGGATPRRRASACASSCWSRTPTSRVHGARAVLRAAEDAYQRARLHRDMAAARGQERAARPHRADARRGRPDPVRGGPHPRRRQPAHGAGRVRRRGGRRRSRCSTPAASRPAGRPRRRSMTD